MSLDACMMLIEVREKPNALNPCMTAASAMRERFPFSPMTAIFIRLRFQALTMVSGHQALRNKGRQVTD